MIQSKYDFDYLSKKMAQNFLFYLAEFFKVIWVPFS